MTLSPLIAEAGSPNFVIYLSNTEIHICKTSVHDVIEIHLRERFGPLTTSDYTLDNLKTKKIGQIVRTQNRSRRCLQTPMTVM